MLFISVHERPAVRVDDQNVKEIENQSRPGQAIAAMDSKSFILLHDDREWLLEDERVIKVC